jgi:D-arabinose 1-dehydrogenase-like Zn-dependent alcohol dehydrogenase
MNIYGGRISTFVFLLLTLTSGTRYLMKALLLSAYNQLELKDLPSPTPGPDELLIQVSACGICGSDVHGYDGSTGRRIPPIVMGHEASGVVTSVGAGRSCDLRFDGVLWQMRVLSEG